jgi:hypothetical protein
MKSFRKNQEGKFVCEECERSYKNVQQLSAHINNTHNGKDNYFNKWLRDDNDGKCKICGNKVKLTERLFPYYKNCCCKECINIYNYKQTELGCLEKYKVKNYAMLDKCVQKIKKTKKKDMVVKIIII